MEGCVGQESGLSKPEDGKVAIWKEVREMLADCIARRCETLAAEANGERIRALFLISIEVDVLVPWDTVPAIALMNFEQMESNQICAVSTGREHWDFIAPGIFSFMRTTMQKIMERVPASMPIDYTTDSLNLCGGGVVWDFTADRRRAVPYSIRAE